MPEELISQILKPHVKEICVSLYNMYLNIIFLVYMSQLMTSLIYGVLSTRSFRIISKIKQQLNRPILFPHLKLFRA